MSRIIIGAGKTSFDGWISTQSDELDLTDRASFESYFGNEKADAMLCEHVFEHIEPEKAVEAAKNCFDFLKDGGYIRVAVPDVNFRNEWYHNMCKIGGNGDPSHPAFSHKVFYDYKSFVSVFENAGFEVELLEYCDENGVFHYKYWNEADGKIGRSFRFDTRNSIDKLSMVSIIIDAKKPLLLEKYS